MGILHTIFGGGAAALVSEIGAAGDKLFTSDEERQEWATTKMRMAVTVIEAETRRGGLAGNWRPITALVFVALIVARWLGWTAPGMSEAEYLSVYQLVKIMIGGYVVSRGGEKIVDKVVERWGRKDDGP